MSKAGLSTATSPQARWTVVSKAATDGTVISPERKRPKKTRCGSGPHHEGVVGDL